MMPHHRGLKASLYARMAVLVAAAALAGRCRGEVPTELQLMTARPTTCSYERAFGMYGVHCGGLKLTAVPADLKYGIEILDASDNKIRELKHDTFTSYTGVKYLYLEDNSIYVIEDEALAPLTYMETLDLSRNALTSLPNSVLKLPSLRKLQLNGNALIYWDFQLKTLQKPIKAPLDYLDVSDCKLRALPDLGVLPELKMYNVSDNPLVNVLAVRFAETCKLERVDLSRSLEKVPLCSLKPVIEWFPLYDVYFTLDDYSRLNTNEFHRCPSLVTGDGLNATFARCASIVTSRPAYRTPRQTWVTVTGGLAGFLVAFMLLLYLMHRSNVSRTKRTRKNRPMKAGERTAGNKATENLLSDVS